MRDCERKDLHIGQKVVYTNSKTSGVLIGKVIGFTAKMVKIKTSYGWEMIKTPSNLYGV